MRAGKLRHTVTIERLTIVQDEETGAVDEVWAAIGSYAASVEPINGREYFAAAAVQSEITTRIRTRYVAGIRPSDRVTHGDKVYNVLSVINKEMKNIQLELMCKSAG